MILLQTLDDLCSTSRQTFLEALKYVGSDNFKLHAEGAELDPDGLLKAFAELANMSEIQKHAALPEIKQLLS
jgi:hypothetical protein